PNAKAPLPASLPEIGKGALFILSTAQQACGYAVEACRKLVSNRTYFITAYNVTPSLKIAISLKPFRSLCVNTSPDAIAISCSHSSSLNCSIVRPSSNRPALKSIQFFLRSANSLFVEILTVGTGPPNGVPLPVVNKTICAPAALNAVTDTRSLPGASSKVKPCCCTRSP